MLVYPFLLPLQRVGEDDEVEFTIENPFADGGNRPTKVSISPKRDLGGDWEIVESLDFPTVPGTAPTVFFKVKSTRRGGAFFALAFVNVIPDNGMSNSSMSISAKDALEVVIDQLKKAEEQDLKTGGNSARKVFDVLWGESYYPFPEQLFFWEYREFMRRLDGQTLPIERYFLPIVEPYHLFTFKPRQSPRVPCISVHIEEFHEESVGFHMNRLKNSTWTLEYAEKFHVCDVFFLIFEIVKAYWMLATETLRNVLDAEAVEHGDMHAPLGRSFLIEWRGFEDLLVTESDDRLTWFRLGKCKRVPTMSLPEDEVYHFGRDRDASRPKLVYSETYATIERVLWSTREWLRALNDVPEFKSFWGERDDWAYLNRFLDLYIRIFGTPHYDEHGNVRKGENHSDMTRPFNFLWFLRKVRIQETIYSEEDKVKSTYPWRRYL